MLQLAEQSLYGRYNTPLTAKGNVLRVYVADKVKKVEAIAYEIMSLNLVSVSDPVWIKEPVKSIEYLCNLPETAPSLNESDIPCYLGK